MTTKGEREASAKLRREEREAALIEKLVEEAPPLNEDQLRILRAVFAKP